MTLSDIVKGHLTLEVTDYGVAGESDFEMFSEMGKGVIFDAFVKTMKMYNPWDIMQMMAILSAGGIEKLLGDKVDITTVDLSHLDKMMKDGHTDETEI